MENEQIRKTNNFLDRILQPESQKLAYEPFLPSSKELARNIAAFANAEGGKIILGVRQTEDDFLLTIYTVAGYWKDLSIYETFNDALQFLNPTPIVKYSLFNINGEPRQILEIQPSSEPIFTKERQYFVRRGLSTYLIEENLLRALVYAVPEFTPNIRNSLNSKEYNTEESGATNDVRKNVYERLEEIPNSKLHQLLSESIKHTRDELSMQRSERLHQANIAFIVALVFLILAMLFVFTGVILIFTVNLQTGVVISVSSIVSGIVSGLVFSFNKQANDRVDKYTEEMIVLEKCHTALTFAAYITDIRMRDTAISDLAKTISSGYFESK